MGKGENQVLHIQEASTANRLVIQVGVISSLYLRAMAEWMEKMQRIVIHNVSIGDWGKYLLT